MEAHGFAAALVTPHDWRFRDDFDEVGFGIIREHENGAGDAIQRLTELKIDPNTEKAEQLKELSIRAAALQEAISGFGRAPNQPLGVVDPVTSTTLPELLSFSAVVNPLNPATTIVHPSCRQSHGESK